MSSDKYKMKGIPEDITNPRGVYVRTEYGFWRPADEEDDLETLFRPEFDADAVDVATDTWLPVFPGFYETWFSSECAEESALEYVNESRKEKGLKPVEYDALKFDIEDYEYRVVDEVSDLVRDHLRSFRVFTDWRFQAVHSPKYYNYSNDEGQIQVGTSFADRARLHGLLLDNVGMFEQFLTRYRGCDGFISHHSPEVGDWLSDFDGTCADRHELGAVLEFVATCLPTPDGADPLDADVLYQTCEQTQNVNVMNLEELIHDCADIQCGRCGRRLFADVLEDPDVRIVEPCDCGFRRMKSYLSFHNILTSELERELDQAWNCMDHVNLPEGQPSKQLEELWKLMPDQHERLNNG